MKPNIDHLTEAELIELNHKIVERLRLMRQIRSHKEMFQFKIGDRVKTLRGSTRGIIVRKLADGRLVWKPEGSGAELISFPESLIPDSKPQP